MVKLHDNYTFIVFVQLYDNHQNNFGFSATAGFFLRSDWNPERIDGVTVGFVWVLAHKGKPPATSSETESQSEQRVFYRFSSSSNDCFATLCTFRSENFRKLNEITQLPEVNVTSLEMAELTGKQHKNVMQAIRNMEPAWEKVNGLKFQLVNYKDQKGELRPCYQLTKTECLYIATKFNDEARVRRWKTSPTCWPRKYRKMHN